MTQRRQLIIRYTGLLIVLLALVPAARSDDFNEGVYSATAGGVKFSIKFDKGGKVTIMRNGEIVVEGTYKVKEDGLEVTDEKGPFACRGDQKTGKYKWRSEGKKLTLTKVEDECEGRANALTSQVWVQE